MEDTEEAIKSLMQTLEEDIEQTTNPTERRKLIFRWDSLMSKLLQMQRIKRRKKRKQEAELVPCEVEFWDGKKVTALVLKKEEEE